MKRLYILLFAFMLLLLFMPVTAAMAKGLKEHTSGSWTYLLDGENAVLSGYRGNGNTVLDIPAAIDNHPVSGIGNMELAGSDTITYIIIPDSVASIA